MSIESLRFDDLGNSPCRLHAHSVERTSRLGTPMVASIMEVGVIEGCERLDDVVAALCLNWSTLLPEI